MAPSAFDLARLRRMVDEPTEDSYTDETISTYLEAWPLVDSLGRDFNNTSWTEGYDLNAAAADIWDEKAAAVQSKHDFSADGASYSASQMFDKAKEMAKHFRAMQKSSVKRVPLPSARGTYFDNYANPVFDEDEPPDFTDSIV